MKYALGLIIFANLLGISIGFVLGRFVFDLSPPFMFLGFVLGLGTINLTALWAIYSSKRNRSDSRDGSAK